MGIRFVVRGRSVSAQVGRPRRTTTNCVFGVLLCFALLASCTPSRRTDGLHAGIPAGGFAGVAGSPQIASGGVAGVSIIGLSGASGNEWGGAGGEASRHLLVDFLRDPDYPDDYFTPVTPTEAGLDAATLEGAVEWIDASGWEIRSFLVVYEGRLVLERYGWSSGGDPQDTEPAHQVVPVERQPQYSVTKSFLSALVGIALAEGSLGSVDDPAADWFPDYEALAPSPAKSSITLGDLLTMRSGLEWTEGDQSTFDADDPARAMLSRPVVDEPVGEVWNYSTGGSDIIAEILRVATGQTPLDYATEKLFGPLGIVAPSWVGGASGTQHGGWGLSLTSREMARFGELYRNVGTWGDTQVVPAEWVTLSTSSHTGTAWYRDYGYHWWISNISGAFNAFGAYGQEIWISPSRDLVVIFTGSLPNDVAETIFETLIRDYVLAALPARVPLP